MRDELERLKRPIRIGLIGIGAMGRGLLHQAKVTPGIVCVAAADLDVQRATQACEQLELDARIAHNAAEVEDVIRGSKIAVTDDGDLVAASESVDVLIEASSSIAPAGRFAVTALNAGKHVVMMNAEADLIFGPHLLELARRHGVVYTSCDGDQPGPIKHLVDDLTMWGFELVMAGNIKGFLDRYSDPTKIIPEADERNLDYQMCTAYTDGTKLCVEMSLVANALNLRTDVPGMHGPKAGHVRDVLELFDLEAVRAGGPVVDYILGAEPDGGVFVIGYCDDAYQASMLKYYKMGDGPFYVLYRPYHLCHIEAMTTVADAFLHNRALLEPVHGFRTNVYAYAKRDLRAGEKLDGIGGYTCYGLIENCTDDSGIPICLADDVVVTRDIAQDDKILMADVECDRNRDDFLLFDKAVRSVMLRT